MSETQAPPPPAAEPQKKYLLDNPVLRALLDVAALASPAPLLLVLINFWLEAMAPAALKTQDASAVFRQIFTGSGDPPMWTLPLAFVPGAALLILIHRKSGPKMLLALIALLAVASAEIFYFMQLAN